MSSKPFRRKDLKHDEFITVTGQASHWLMERRRRIGWALLAVALVVSIVASVRFAHQRQEQRAAELLSGAMDVYRAPVVPPAPTAAALPVADDTEGAPEAGETAGGDTPPTGGEAVATGSETAAVGDETGAGGGETAAAGSDATAVEGTPADAGEAGVEPVPAPVVTGLQFASAAEKYRAAVTRFEPIVERYGTRPSGRVAAYYMGICQVELGDTAAAIASLAQASEASGQLVASMALYRLGQVELDAGNAEAAVGYFDRLVERDDGFFPLEEALMAKARAQREAGDPRAALATYQRVLLDFSGSYAEIEARSNVEELSAQLGVDPDIQGD